MSPSGVAAVIVAILLAAAPVGLAAQQTSAPVDPARFRSDIVVTPERGDSDRAQVPASTVTLETAALQAHPAVSMSEALAFLPGFDVSRGGFHAGPPLVSARGFFGGGEADYVLLLIDGVPWADAESGLIDWSVIPLASVRRIEGLRGPGASMYGDAAVGGVVQILTNRADQGTQLTTSAGEFGTLTFDGSHRRRIGNVGADLSGTLRRTSGISDHSDARYFSAAGAIDGRVGRSLWRLTGTGNGRSNQDPGAPSLAIVRRDPRASDPLSRFDEVERHGFAGAFTLQRTGGAWGHQGRIYANTRDEDQTRTILLAPGLGDRQTRALSTRSVGGSAEGERRLGAAVRGAVVRYGLDLLGQHLETSYRPVDDEGIAGAPGDQVSGRRLRVGGFVSSAVDLVPRVRLSGAVRWDRVADGAFATEAGTVHRAWSPRLGVTVGLGASRPVWLYSQVSRAFKVPTVNQLFDPRPYPDFSGGSFTISNRTLVPQRATTVEAGIRGGADRLQWNALVYRMHVENEIDFDARTFAYANIGESRHTGLEFEVGGRVWRRLQPSVRYVLSAVGPIATDRQLKNVPRHAVILATQVDLPLGLAASLRYRRTSGAFLDDGNALAIQGPSTLDVRLRRAVGRHQLFLDVSNLTNDRYEEYGFTLDDFRGGLAAYAYPGAPRAFRVGVTLGL